MEVKSKMLTKTYAVFLAFFVVMLTSQLSWAAAGRIEGKVKDVSTGEPLPGVTIEIEGTSLGAATDLGGNYFIANIPVGSYTLKVSYVGYKSKTIKVHLNADERLEEDIALEAVGVKTKEVVITAQASGQNAAINQQLTSDNVVNVVSSARIQSLPDENAAASVGRLPGVSLVRSGGEATQVVIRGLAPQYNLITIDGVPIPPTDANDRGTNLSMISSSSLQGIEVYKTVTPDMDAAVIGGTVNFDIREAKATPNGAPLVSLLAQGGYDNLVSTYNDYKFMASVEKRFFNNRFGIFAQGIAQRQTLTSDQLGAGYYIINPVYPNRIALSSINLSFNPSEQQIYDGTLTMDYKLPNGKIDFVNMFNHGNTDAQYHNESYSISGNNISYGTDYEPNKLNVITSILAYEQRLFSVKVDAKLSFSFSDNRSPDNWSLGFEQSGAGITGIPDTANPVYIARAAQANADFNNTFLENYSTWYSYNKQSNYTAQVDLQRGFNISDLISLKLKAGGVYRYTSRYYNYDDGGGGLYLDLSTLQTVRAAIIKDFPWMAQSPYNLNPDGSQLFPMTMFLEPMNFGKFLGGDYAMYSATNIPLISQVLDKIVAYGSSITTAGTGGVNAYLPDVFGSQASDYTGNEYRSAGYIMATVNIGPQLTLIPGVRYQGLETSYTAAHFLNASSPNPYPNPLPHTDSTVTEYHGYWLPDVSVRYDPFRWFSVRAAYTTTLAYPDFGSIIPILQVYSAGVVWNNYALKPAVSHNYDLQMSVYNNSIGLLSISPFLKRIDNMIFHQSTYITDPSLYPGIPNYTKGYAMSVNINNPYPVNVWGIEAEWQTNFWYLPNPLKGLVLNVNYTHIFSGAKYPLTTVGNSGFPYYKPVYVDTFYTDRLLQQPNDLANVSIGYDYRQFSILVSMIYQSNVYNGTNFYNSLRSDKAKYMRWDLVVKQGLPWHGLEAFLDINNLNSESDTYVIRGSGFPTSESDYGMSADLGLRWTLQ